MTARILDNGGAHRTPLQAKTKTPSDPGKTENEGIQRTLSKIVRQAGLILLFDGEVGLVDGLWLMVDKKPPEASRYQLSTLNYQLPRRAQPNRYPDFGLKPPSRLPEAIDGLELAVDGKHLPAYQLSTLNYQPLQWPWELVAVTVAQPSRISTGFPDI